MSWWTDRRSLGDSRGVSVIEAEQAVDGWRRQAVLSERPGWKASQYDPEAPVSELLTVSYFTRFDAGFPLGWTTSSDIPAVWQLWNQGSDAFDGNHLANYCALFCDNYFDTQDLISARQLTEGIVGRLKRRSDIGLVTGLRNRAELEISERFAAAGGSVLAILAGPLEDFVDSGRLRSFSGLSTARVIWSGEDALIQGAVSQFSRLVSPSRLLRRDRRVARAAVRSGPNSIAYSAEADPPAIWIPYLILESEHSLTGDTAGWSIRGDPGCTTSLAMRFRREYPGQVEIGGSFIENLLNRYHGSKGRMAQLA